MDGCYINVQFFAINCCKLFLSVLNCTTATKAWRLRNIGEHMKFKQKTVLIACLLASAAVSLSILYGLWWLAGVV
jgi:hypothetical protein